MNKACELIMLRTELNMDHRVIKSGTILFKLVIGIKIYLLLKGSERCLFNVLTLLD